MARPNDDRLVREWATVLKFFLDGAVYPQNVRGRLMGLLRPKPDRVPAVRELGFFNEPDIHHRPRWRLVHVEKLLEWLRAMGYARHAKAVELAHALLMLGDDPNSLFRRQV